MLALHLRANVQNVNFETLNGQFTLSTQLMIQNYSVILSHRCRTTVSLETYPPYMIIIVWFCWAVIFLCWNVVFTVTFILLQFKKHTIDMNNHFAIRESWGKLEHSDWFLLGLYFAIWTVFTEMFISCVHFVTKASKFK